MFLCSLALQYHTMQKLRNNCYGASSRSAATAVSSHFESIVIMQYYALQS